MDINMDIPREVGLILVFALGLLGLYVIGSLDEKLDRIDIRKKSLKDTE